MDKHLQTTENELVTDPNFKPDEGGYLVHKFGDVVLRRADQISGSPVKHTLSVTRTWTHPQPGKPFDQKVYGTPRQG